MTNLYTLKSAYRALRANKVRSGLTILGVVIGITAIMLIVSIGGGAQKLILGQIQGFGADMLVVRPGREPKGPTDLPQSLFSDSLKERELTALTHKENVPELAAIAPVVFVSEPVSYESETYRPTIFGWSAEFMLTVQNITMNKGVPFDENDIHQNASVAVIGPKVVEKLFDNKDALGKFIRIKGRNFHVVGILNKKGAGAFFDSDDLVVIPYTTAMTYLTGSKHYFEFVTRAKTPDAIPRMSADITATLRELHNITDTTKDDFYIMTQQGVINQVSTILTALTAFLTAVVAISLIVGGIGVMNVMLVSVTERTREIGLRKALGARNKDILLQFLMEAILLSLGGGIIGVTLGTTLGFLTAIGLSRGLGLAWEFTFPLGAMLVGLSVSMVVGIIFGLYPAWKASRKSPIEALRYE